MAKRKTAASRAKAASASVARNPVNQIVAPQRTFASQIATSEVPDDDIFALRLDFQVEDIDFDIIESGLHAVAQERWAATPRNRRDRRLEQRFNRNRGLRRNVAARAFNRYLAEGGDPNNVQGWLNWLIANWESIFNIIKTLIGAFGGAV